MADLEEIGELDINPLVAQANSVVAVDARVILASRGDRSPSP
jgi:succinyl-CoA synthetase beta subunit